MTHLDLSDEEVEALTTLLASALGDLSAEIVGTDNPFYRSGLRDHRSALEHVQRKLLDRSGEHPGEGAIPPS